MSQSKTLKKEKLTFNTIWQRYGTFGILIILLAILAILKPTYFFSSSTAPQILAQSSVNILIAMGEFFAILIAGIDLSVGSVVALTGMCMAKLMVAGVNPIVAVLLGILLGAFLGFLNGLLVNVTGLHPFIITLGTQAIYRGRYTYNLKFKRGLRLPGKFYKSYFKICYRYSSCCDNSGYCSFDPCVSH